MDKDCFSCEFYCDNGWREICLNKNNHSGILAVEKGEEECDLYKEVYPEETLRQLMKTEDEPKKFTFIPKGGNYANPYTDIPR